MEENLPPGFRFHPTDEELISYYLTQKLSDSSFTSKAIGVVDLNKNEPWDLPAKATMGEKEWYFFSLRDRKYPTGLRTNRATEAGYWKTTGKDKEIFGVGHVLVGMKKTLVFYKGRAPRGEKSNWVMHEYRQQTSHFFKPSKEEWVVCRVFQKQNTPKKPQQSSSSQPSLSSPCDTNSIVNEFGDHIELSNFNNNNIISSQTYENNNMINNDNNNNNNMMNMNMNMNLNLNNWVSPTNETLIPSLSWPLNSNLLTSSNNLSMNSLLLKALQLRTFQQQRDNVLASSSSNTFNNNIHDHHHQAANIVHSQFGTTNDHLSCFQPSSSSKVFESSSQQQQQQEEQPLNLDSLW